MAHALARFSFAILLGALATAGGCALPRGDISLNPEWPPESPEKPGAYEAAHRAWTRHAILRRDYQEALSVYATFKSPTFRTAFVAHKARRSSMTPAEKEALLAAERAASEGAYEVELLVTTWDYRENELQKGPRSLWRVALRDDRGNEVLAESIARDRRPRYTIRAEYPDLEDFAKAYIVRFPRSIELLRPNARQFSLEIASSRGGVTLTWNAASSQ